MTKSEVAVVLRNFLNDQGGKWDWDDFISVSIEDAELDEIRIQCAELHDEYPPDVKGHYCNEQGLKVLESLLRKCES